MEAWIFLGVFLIYSLLLHGILIESIHFSLYIILLASFVLIYAIFSEETNGFQSEKTQPQPHKQAKPLLHECEWTLWIHTLVCVPVFEWCIKGILISLLAHLFLIIVHRVAFAELLVEVILPLVLLLLTMKFFSSFILRLLLLMHLFHSLLEITEWVVTLLITFKALARCEVFLSLSLERLSLLVFTLVAIFEESILISFGVSICGLPLILLILLIIVTILLLLLLVVTILLLFLSSLLVITESKEIWVGLLLLGPFMLLLGILMARLTLRLVLVRIVWLGAMLIGSSTAGRFPFTSLSCVTQHFVCTLNFFKFFNSLSICFIWMIFLSQFVIRDFDLFFLSTLIYS